MMSLVAAVLCAACVCAVASPAFAVDWIVGPAAAWEGDATVNVVHWFTDGAGGPQLGADNLMIGPLQPGVFRPIDAVAFEGSGKIVCAVAVAERGTTRSSEVSDCQTFQLGPPTLSH